MTGDIGSVCACKRACVSTARWLPSCLYVCVPLCQKDVVQVTTLAWFNPHKKSAATKQAVFADRINAYLVHLSLRLFQLFRPERGNKDMKKIEHSLSLAAIGRIRKLRQPQHCSTLTFLGKNVLGGKTQLKPTSLVLRQIVQFGHVSSRMDNTYCILGVLPFVCSELLQLAVDDSQDSAGRESLALLHATRRQICSLAKLKLLMRAVHVTGDFPGRGSGRMNETRRVASPRRRKQELLGTSAP